MPFFSGKRDSYEDDNLGIDWVVHYVFDDVGTSIAYIGFYSAVLTVLRTHTGNS